MLLRHSQHKLPLPAKVLPSAKALALQLAARIDAWSRTLRSVLKAEARGDEPEDWEKDMVEG